uniref:Uncharacterized protein n=1 Tax=Myoviridae sp. ct6F13 TaxID=2827602 RepID=A0A8S5LJG5_9CAUD|nr:MAG TPA: hypothetical protein [Myoviridae sp. ct6F13]
MNIISHFEIMLNFYFISFRDDWIDYIYFSLIFF